MDATAKDTTRTIGGYATVELIREGKDGPRVISRETVDNVVLNSGKRLTWLMSSGKDTRQWDYYRLGKSAVSAADTAFDNVKSAITDSLINIPSAQRTILAGRTFQWVISYIASGGGFTGSNNTIISSNSIQESVILNEGTSPGGSALMRITFTAVNKTRADKLKVTYTLRFV